MKIGVFTLPEVLMKKDPNMVINDRYPFKDGKLQLAEIVARQLENILVRLYECSIEYIEATPAEDAPVHSGSLAKVQTQPGAKVEPPKQSTPAATADVHAKPDPNAVKSVIDSSIAQGQAAAESVKK